ncbi:MAG: tRNA (adenosine(37)-N6)-dimethylallyltransferase MiaA [Patescibacteria group bacterium]
MNKIIVILGQTATGKSNLAVKIAQRISGEIISVDSRQIYKNLNIGTGKITPKEMQGIPHHLLDVVNPKYKFTVIEYQKLAISAIADIYKRNKTPIICGGTGFYIDAITKGIIFPEVLPNNKLRKHLLQKDATALFYKLKKLDPVKAKNIDPKNKQRLIRAIEIAQALGSVPPITQALPVYKFIKIGLCLPQEILKKKVDKRVKKMFDKKNHGGLLNEIKKLKKPARLGGSGVSEKRLRELGFEYNNPTYEKVVQETLQYAKRQMTWFKRDKEIKWFTNSSLAFAYIHKLSAK